MSPKKTRRKKSKRKSRTSRLGLFIKLLIVSFVIVAAYAIFLDIKVTRHFEGKRWALAARVYATPLDLYPGLPLTKQRLTRHLKRLSYKPVRQVSRPGRFAVGSGRMDIHTRSFQFWDGKSAGSLISVYFDNDIISRIVDTAANKAISLTRLEPVLVGSFYPAHNEDRILVRLDDVPPMLIKALLVTEDRDFYEHFGLSLKGIARAMWANIRAGGAVQGGSTLTQQLVKNFYLTHERTLWRKFNEAIMALLLEYHYEKNEILEAYINEVYLGQEGRRAIHGFGLASQFYFEKPVGELSLTQATLLVSLVKGASYYNPRKHPKRARARRNLILDTMASLSVITKQQATTAKRVSLGVTPTIPGLTSRYPGFMELLRRQLRRDYREEDLRSEGLRIFSTMDVFTQDSTEQRFSASLDLLESIRPQKGGALEGAVIVTNTANGEVLALIGGRKPKRAGFNRALDALRPVGSLIKPSVYLTALEKPDRYTVTSRIDDSPVKFDNGDGTYWQPANFDKIFHGEVPLHLALSHSYNVATVRLGLQVGINEVIHSLKKLGLQRPMHAYPSLLLGAEEFTPIEIAQMYQTLAGGGFRTPLRAIREVADVNGKPLQRYPLRVEQVFSTESVYLVNKILQQVIKEGTARGMKHYLRQDLAIAGKTGTTNDLRDSWFAGFTGDRLAVVWIGRDDNKPAGFTGSNGAMRVWAKVMSALSVQPLILDTPQGIEYRWVDQETGLLGDSGCEHAGRFPYIKGSAPTRHAACGGGRFHDTLDDVLDWFTGD